MKLQISLIPEKLLDILTLIVVISITFGMYILYSEYRLELKRDENVNLENYNFAQVFIGDKCILYKNLSKGILDYNKIKNKESCLNIVKNVNIVIDNEKIVYGSDCEKAIEKIVIPIIVFIGPNFREAKLIVC